MVNFITSVSYHFCPSFPAAFTQPGAPTLDISVHVSSCISEAELAPAPVAVPSVRGSSVSSRCFQTWPEIRDDKEDRRGTDGWGERATCHPFPYFLTSFLAACDSHAHNPLPAALSHAPISYFDQDEKEKDAERFREGGTDTARRKPCGRRYQPRDRGPLHSLIQF